MARKPNASKQGMALELALEGKSVQEICSTVGCSMATFYRWRNTPEFGEQFRERQTEGLDTVHARLVRGTSKAIDALIEVLCASNADVNAMAKVQAARILFEIAGIHKGAPLKRSQQVADIEDDDDVIETLSTYPDDLLRAALAQRESPRQKDL